MSNTPTVNIEGRVEQYVKLRDMIKELDDAHKAKMKPYRETLEKLNAVLMQHLQNIGVDSAKTGAGTVYQKTKNSASIADADLFMKHVVDHGMFELLDRKANVTAVVAYIQEYNVPPPGINFSTSMDVGVRRS